MSNIVEYTSISVETGGGSITVIRNRVNDIVRPLWQHKANNVELHEEGLRKVVFCEPSSANFLMLV